MTKLLESDDFTIWQPGTVQIIKSEGGSEERRIGGYCSTEHLDRQSEVVLQKGLDFSEFVKHGYFNDNHNQATSAVVGVPESAEYHAGKGWYTEGTLLKGFSRADEIWGLAKSLEDTHRRLGFSIEGKVIERNGNHIVKAKIRNVAVTNCPVNPNCTWDILAKSFGDEAIERALSAGSAVSPTTGGGVLVPEDLEHDEVRQVWKCKKCEKAFRSAKGFESHQASHKSGSSKKAVARKSRVFDETSAVALLKSIRPGYSEAVCQKLFHLVSKGK